MAATLKKQMWFHSSPDGLPPEVRTYPIAASQGVFMPGYPCYISTSGLVNKANTCDGTGDVFHGFVIGLEDKQAAWPITAELAVNTKVRVQMIDPDDFYVVQVENNGTDAAAPTTIVGDEYALKVSTTAGEIGFTTMDLNDSTNEAVMVWQVMSQLDPLKYSATSTPGWALVKFLNAHVNAVKAAE
jgi:hypothetical protein